MKTAKYIDHTLLKPDARREDIVRLCEEALRYDFASVCVNPSRIETAAEILQGSDVKVCCVIGFPLGAMSTAAKVFEASDAVTRGAQEIDMVLNIGFIKDGNDAAVTEEIRAVKNAVGSRVLKVIIETCLLDEAEIVRACRDSVDGGADYVKTSTGFSAGGAKTEDVALMRKTVGSRAGVKASGGIRTPEAFRAMIEAGANRIGTSSGAAIVEALEQE